MVGRARAELAEVLRGSRLFSGLNRTQLSTLAKACTARRYEPGDAIVRQLDQGQHMALIVQGKANVVRNGRTIATAGPGDAVGEMSLIDGLPCSASVIAETPIDAVVLYRTTFRKLLADSPALAGKLLLAQTARVRELDRRAATLG